MGRVMRSFAGSQSETEVMINDADPDPEPIVPPAELPQESKRNLTSVLLSDLNTVAVTTVSAITGAYAVKRVMGRGSDDGSGSDSGPGPDSGS